MKNVVIIGAGPAGLTAALELLSKSKEYQVLILEESSCIGGICRTVNWHGNRMDMGGHRFFSRIPEVNEWWERLLPSQGSPSLDDKLLDKPCRLKEGGPDPEANDSVMLIRRRLSRILFEDHFYDYPITMSWRTLKNLGAGNTLVAGFSYLKSLLHKRDEKSLENFYINRFGKKLYSMFFERYTQNLWGRHPREISAEWGAQRVKGLSVKAILKDILGKSFHRKNHRIETSLIEEFLYPKLGPGQLWEEAAKKIEALGGKILYHAKAEGFLLSPDRTISKLRYSTPERDQILDCDDAWVLSSMPLKDLVEGMENVPPEINAIASALPYRDYMTCGVLLSGLNLKNSTAIRTLGDIIPDNWIYVHENKVNMLRLQIYNNWSPYLLRDPEHTVWLGLEYFCNEGDSLWSMTDAQFSELAVSELKALGFIHSENEVLDQHVERVKKAYPAYFDSYARIDELRNYLDKISNLICIGRNGQHRYNNMDHSMCTAFEAVKYILGSVPDRSGIWNINTEQEYHEDSG